MRAPTCRWPRSPSRVSTPGGGPVIVAFHPHRARPPRGGDRRRRSRGRRARRCAGSRAAGRVTSSSLPAIGRRGLVPPGLVVALEVDAARRLGVAADPSARRRPAGRPPTEPLRRRRCASDSPVAVRWTWVSMNPGTIVAPGQVDDPVGIRRSPGPDPLDVTCRRPAATPPVSGMALRPDAGGSVQGPHGARIIARSCDRPVRSLGLEQTVGGLVRVGQDRRSWTGWPARPTSASARWNASCARTASGAVGQTATTSSTHRRRVDPCAAASHGRPRRRTALASGADGDGPTGRPTTATLLRGSRRTARCTRVDVGGRSRAPRRSAVSTTSARDRGEARRGRRRRTRRYRAVATSWRRQRARNGRRARLQSATHDAFEPRPTLDWRRRVGAQGRFDRRNDPGDGVRVAAIGRRHRVDASRAGPAAGLGTTWKVGSATPLVRVERSRRAQGRPPGRSYAGIAVRCHGPSSAPSGYTGGAVDAIGRGGRAASPARIPRVIPSRPSDHRPRMGPVLDERDLEIIAALQDDARATYADVGHAGRACRRRRSTTGSASSSSRA